jgi:radical SAM superfamily enzyme YgiQ (UPF0313 family)
MKVLLISPASGAWKGISRRRLFNGKTFRFSMLSLLTLAALTPGKHKVRIIDEQVEEVPFEEAFDIVGITVMTALAPEAYEIAARFRARGIPVVLGGFHVTLNPEEALMHADAIVTGPAFGAWERVLSDLETGNLSLLYKGDPEGKIPSALPRGLLEKSHYITMNATYATMGCVNKCQFCSISAFHEGKRHFRPVREVASEIASFSGKFFMLLDDNLTQDREYAHALLKEIAPLKKKWITQATLDLAEDPETLELLSRAGCAGVFVGLETINEETLREQEKDCNAPRKYRKAVLSFHKHGIFVESGVMFGFDRDTTKSFRNTLNMLHRIGIDAIQVSILTPVPGTPLHIKMKQRIFDFNWGHYDYKHVVFTPRLMNAEELKAGADWVIRRFYSPANIAKRALRWILMPGGLKNFIYPFVLNMAYYGRVKAFSIKGYDPAIAQGKTPNHLRGFISKMKAA